MTPLTVSKFILALVVTCGTFSSGLRTEDAESERPRSKTQSQEGMAHLLSNASLHKQAPAADDVKTRAQLQQFATQTPAIIHNQSTINPFKFHLDTPNASAAQSPSLVSSQPLSNDSILIGKSLFESGSAVGDNMSKSSKETVLCANAMLLTVCIIFLTFCPLGPIGYAFIAMIVWGVDMFALGYVNVICPRPYFFFIGKFIATGIEGVTLHFYNNVYDANYQNGLQSVKGMCPRSKILFGVVPGCALFFGDIMTVTGFGLDVEAAGVNGMIVCLNPAIVALFFYFVAAEKPSCMQLLGGIIALGGGLMSEVVGVQEGEAAIEQMGLLWCALAMLCYATVIILMRLASIEGLTWKPLWVSRCVALGVGGTTLLAMYPFLLTEIPSIGWELPVWTLIATAGDELGLYSMVRSFQFPSVKTGVQASLGASSVIVNIILGWILLGQQQPFLKYVAAGTSFLGIIVLSFG